MNRAERVYFLLIVLLIGTTAAGLSRLLQQSSTDTPTPLAFHEAEPAPDMSVIVDGTADHPGIYTVSMTSTLADVILLAGVEPGAQTPTLHIDVRASDDEVGYQRVDINHAEAWLLQSLPGIGADRAKAIVDHRASHGSFACPEELVLVEGIGEKTYEAIAPLITAE